MTVVRLCECTKYTSGMNTRRAERSSADFGTVQKNCLFALYSLCYEYVLDLR